MPPRVPSSSAASIGTFSTLLLGALAILLSSLWPFRKFNFPATFADEGAMGYQGRKCIRYGAAKYFEIKEDYRKASINLAKKSIEKYAQSLLEANAKIQSESDRKLQVQAQMAAHLPTRRQPQPDQGLGRSAPKTGVNGHGLLAEGGRVVHVMTS